MLKTTPLVNPSVDEGAGNLALQSLFEQEESPLLRYAFSLVGRREVAEEIVQEVFLRLHAQWDGVQEPKAWLYRVVRNRAFNYLRDSMREVLRGDEVECPDRDADRPERQMQQMEAVAALRSMLAELTESDRQLVKLKYFENLKYREIGQRMGLTVSNVGYRLHHILKELAGRLRPLGIDEIS